MPKSPAQLDREIAAALAAPNERHDLPATLKKTYVTISSRAVRAPRGAPAGFEVQLVEPGAAVLFNLFHLTDITPTGMTDYGKAMREHGDVWASWEARRGTVHATLRPRLRKGSYATEDEMRAAALDLARRRGYVVVDSALIRAGLPLDEDA